MCLSRGLSPIEKQWGIIQKETGNEQKRARDVRVWRTRQTSVTHIQQIPALSFWNPFYKFMKTPDASTKAPRRYGHVKGLGMQRIVQGRDLELHNIVV